jgi:chromosome segregation ATPase
MMRSALLLVLWVLGASASNVLHSHQSDSNNKDSVVQKVVEMLQENKLKVMDDLKSEEVDMAEYSQFCDDEQSAKAYAIKTAAAKINDLNAQIDDATAQVKALDDEVATLGTEIAAKDSDVMSAQTLRAKDHDEFVKTEKAMITSVDSLEKAIVLVKRSGAFIQTGGKRPNGAKAYAKKLAEVLGPVVDAAWVDRGSAKVLKGFLQSQTQAKDGDDLSMHLRTSSQKEEAGIMETLEDMKEKAQETLSSARMTEMKANHNHKMMIQSLTDQITLGKSKTSDAKATKAALTEDAGKASGELAETKKTKLADTIYLDDIKLQCSQAAAEWAERQKSAKGEIAAIEKAKDILTSGVKVLVQYEDPYEADSTQDDTAETAVRKRLVSQLQGLGHRLNSYAMMEMASAATEDSFGKIRGLIEEMIAKLVQQANEEASQKAFCDEEKAKSKKEQDAKLMRSDDLKSRIDSASATKAQLGESIKELQGEIAEIDKASGEATKIRNDEKAAYLKAKKDYKDAGKAVEEAIRVLKEFYASQSVPALVQRPKGPSFAQTKGDAASTIIGFLETCAEDFSKMATQIETDEGEAAAAYAKGTDAAKVSKAAKAAEIQGAESEIKVLEVTIAGDSEDLKMVNKELDAVIGYLEKLKPQCELKAMTYEEKKAKREEEIAGLKEALSILDAPVLTQTRKKGIKL